LETGEQSGSIGRGTCANTREPVNRELTASHNQCDGCERNGVEVVMAGGNDIEAERLRAMANRVGWHRVKAVHSSSLSLSLLCFECEGSVWFTEAELHFWVAT
jgi:hypothetical protein